MTPLADTPEPPYWAVVFSNVRHDDGDDVYGRTAERMLELAARQPGFLGVESVRDEHGVGITVSYWSDRDSIAAWRDETEHAIARERGRRSWYRAFRLRVARVERQDAFESEELRAL